MTADEKQAELERQRMLEIELLEKCEVIFYEWDYGHRFGIGLRAPSGKRKAMMFARGHAEYIIAKLERYLGRGQ